MSETQDNFKEQLAKCDDRIEELKLAVQAGEDLHALHENESFNRLIGKGYLEAEGKRIYELLTTPTNLKREQIENLMDKMTAIRNFKAYFKTILIDAAMAPEQIAEEEEYRKSITAQNAIDTKE